MEASPNGVLLVDKPEGWTSHDVVAKTRGALRTRKVGHAGTLDPMATGLLVLGVGPSTRLLTHLVGLDKTYEATIRLGQSTVTDDREGAVRECAPAERVTALAADPDLLRAAAQRLTGSISQVPSAVSAVKVDGRRAYDRVRAGETVELTPREVTVREFTLGSPRLVEATGPAGDTLVLDIDARVRCSSGTYVRALARDLGVGLGVGGHLTALRRSEVGPFAVDEAVSLESVVSGEAGGAVLLRPAAVASRLFPRLELTPAQSSDLQHGKRLELSPGLVPDAPLVAAISPEGDLIGLVRVAADRARVVTNFPVGAAHHEGGQRS